MSAWFFQKFVNLLLEKPTKCSYRKQLCCNASVKWQKTDKTDTPVEDEDDATLDPDDQPTGGGNGGGNTDTGDDIEG